jgi:hypothetical protein
LFIDISLLYSYIHSLYPLYIHACVLGYMDIWISITI